MASPEFVPSRKALVQDRITPRCTRWWAGAGGCALGLFRDSDTYNPLVNDSTPKPAICTVQERMGMDETRPGGWNKSWLSAEMHGRLQPVLVMDSSMRRFSLTPTLAPRPLPKKKVASLKSQRQDLSFRIDDTLADSRTCPGTFIHLISTSRDYWSKGEKSK